MVVKAGDDMIVWRAMEYLSDLLKEAFSVELGCGCEGIFSEKNVFTFQGCAETIHAIKKQG